MSPPPYVDFEVTPAPVRAEPGVWDELNWHDGPTLLGWDYGDAPVETNEGVSHG